MTPSRIGFKFRFEDDEVVHILNDADYLPNIMKTFARFLRASGWEYIGVRETKEGYLFHKEFSWEDGDEENMPDEVEEAEKAYDYWDKAIDEAFAEIDAEPPCESQSVIKVGDTVRFTGTGEDSQGEGYTGVPLLNKIGTVRSWLDYDYVLVEFSDWKDGHDGSGDPNSQGSRCFWYCAVEDLTKVN